MMINEIHGIYGHACPNCGGREEDLRLLMKLPCSRCLPKIPDKGRLSIDEIYEILKRSGRVKNYGRIYEFERKYREFEKLFRKATGSRPWSVQRTWARRVLMDKSFTIVAPTGIGKTLFGMIISLYQAWRHGKAYILTPTTPLTEQIYEKCSKYAEKAGLNVKILRYHANLNRSEKKKILEDIAKGDFNLLITTSKFLSIHHGKLENLKFRLIFVDDVDAILKSSRNIERILKLMGYTEEEISTAFELIKTKSRISSLIRIRFRGKELKDLMDKYRRLEERIRRIGRKNSILIVSTATGRPRGLRVKLFRELLGFDVGARSELLRNVVDAYLTVRDEVELEGKLKELVERLGDGGLIFIPIDRGVEYAERIVNFLEKNGVKAELFTSKNLKALEKFRRGEVQILVGISYYYGVMVRGLDLPERVRYAVFLGVPKFKFSTQLEDPHPLKIFRALTILQEVEEERRGEIQRIIGKLRRYLAMMTIQRINNLREMLAGEVKVENPVARAFGEALKLVREEFSRDEIKKRLDQLEDVRITVEKDKTYIAIPDVMTYIQASGRTSRMYAGGLTKGLAVTIALDEKLLKGLMRRTRWINEEMTWKKLEEVNLNSILDEIDEDRRRIREILEGKLRVELEDPVKSTLLIVESPNKARTIAQFFGKPSVRRIGKIKTYEVSTGNRIITITATGGHLYDLITGEGIHGVMVTDGKYIPIYASIKRCLKCNYQFTDELESCPRCGSREILDKEEMVRSIIELCLESDHILIGTDPDTEGEKIGWDLMVLINPYARRIDRMEFHEVTRKAILNAISNPRSFNRNLVEAQIVRRIEDRWIGFELSSRLWLQFGKRWLSAGRVQTPVLGWIVEREREYSRSIREIYEVTLPFNVKIEIVKGEVEISGESKAKLKVLREWVEKVKPQPPYTTDTYLQDMSRILRLSTSEAMQIAQDLFEMGFITYHRTDSTRVSGVGQMIAREYLKEKYGDRVGEIVRIRKWREGGAHECIRPTKPLNAEKLRKLISEGMLTPIKPITYKHLKAYSLIFRRFIASQMREAEVRRQEAEIEIDGLKFRVERNVEIVEPGFTLENPTLKVEEKLKSGTYRPVKIQVRRKALKTLYSEGDIIALMKRKGIGRPSTYAKIIQTLLQRGYVIKTRRGKLVPTRLGKEVYHYLTSKYSDLVSEERTRMLEEIMDSIERGEAEYLEILRNLHEEIMKITN